jgi:peptide/nickel transport system permease protein
MSQWLLGCLFLLIVIAAPLFAPYDPMAMDTTSIVRAPNSEHLMGTDQLGRDVWSRLLYGGRITLLSTLMALFIAVIGGGGIGLIGGFYGGLIDGIAQLLINGLLAIPGLLLGLMWVTLLGEGIISAAVAVGLIQLAPFAQFARSLSIATAGKAYVTGGYAVGATNTHVLWQYVLKNNLPALLSYTSVTFAYCLLNIAAFGFLGLLGTPGVPEWGVMLAEGREVLREAPWVSTAPGIAITLVVSMANAFADRFNHHK